MLVALAFAAVTFQNRGPILPASCSPAFQATVLSVEESLGKSDFAKASAQLKLLPKLAVGVTWDDTKVRQAYRTQFGGAGQKAMAMWSSLIPGLVFKDTAKGYIRISFEPVLAKRPDQDLPAA